MWFKTKINNKFDVDKKSGDHIKNSNITINSSTDQSHVLMEIYNKIGRLEGGMKGLCKDMQYVKQHIDSHNEKIARLEAEYSLGRKVTR